MIVHQTAGGGSARRRVSDRKLILEIQEKQEQFFAKINAILDRGAEDLAEFREVLRGLEEENVRLRSALVESGAGVAALEEMLLRVLTCEAQSALEQGARRLGAPGFDAAKEETRAEAYYTILHALRTRYAAVALPAAQPPTAPPAGEEGEKAAPPPTRPLTAPGEISDAQLAEARRLHAEAERRGISLRDLMRERTLNVPPGTRIM